MANYHLLVSPPKLLSDIHQLKAQHSLQGTQLHWGWRTVSHLISCPAHAQHVVGVHGSDAVGDQLIAVGPGGGDDVLPGGSFLQLEPEGAQT